MPQVGHRACAPTPGCQSRRCKLPGMELEVAERRPSPAEMFRSDANWVPIRTWVPNMDSPAAVAILLRSAVWQRALGYMPCAANPHEP
jgi:hypothetical protein